MAGKPDGAGVFGRKLAAGDFVVTAEIGPPRGADLSPVATKAAALRGWADAVNITDNQSASVRLSSLAGSVAALGAGVAPIMQLTCRDRNRIALQSELLSASALGIRYVLFMTGDDPSRGDHTDATPVFDLDSVQLLKVARTMRDEGTLMSGRTLTPPPDFMVGVVENPPVELPQPDGDNAAVHRLAAKVQAGAQFAQTQFVFDVPVFAAWMRQLEDLGLTERCKILAGVGPVRSARALAHLARIPGVRIPDHVSARLLGVPPDQVSAEGEKLCGELIAALAEVPGVAGVHIMAIGSEHLIPGILQRAGLGRRANTPRR